MAATAIQWWWKLSSAVAHRALENKRPAVRARAFDVIYNLSVHAELLYPSQTNAFEIDTQAGARPARPALINLPAGAPSYFRAVLPVWYYLSSEVCCCVP